MLTGQSVGEAVAGPLGTHQGEFFGVAATSNRIQMTGIQIDRFDDSGKMVEEWPEYDLLGVMRQLGAVPEAG